MSKLTPLSASRLKTAQTCSWIYWCKYKLHLPDKSNDGASRGTICHLVFECLGNPRHQSHYKKIIKAQSTKGSPAVWRLILSQARKLNVADEDNLDLIDKMTVNGLNYDFFGEDLGKPTEGISEKSFIIEVNEGEKKYKIRGFIDKLFLYSRKKKALIRDFKSSKQKFKGKEVTDNLQNLMYALAVQKLYPEYINRESEFVFLKFDLTKDLFENPGSGIMRMGNMDDSELDGFEYYLTEAQAFIDGFSERDAIKNLAAKQKYPSDGTFGGPLACGKDGFKMSKGQPVLDDNGEPIKAFICSFRKPFTYHVLLTQDGHVKKSVFTEDKLELVADESLGEKIEERFYDGCPHWNREDPFDL